jgi:hypothetical protein
VNKSPEKPGNRNGATPTPALPKTLSQVIGVDPVLPGESAADYQKGLQDLIQELGAKTLLQVYLAEKIYDCLWWIHRYEQQKRATIIAEMASRAGQGFSTNLSQAQIELRESLFNNALNQQAIKTAASVGHSIESLREQAMSRKRGELQLLDNQIALQTKILAGLQASYEHAVNRKMHIERLALQNAMLRRDAGAIEGEPVG